MGRQNNASKKTRIEQHTKRKKTNFILNIMIGVVTLLILVVGASIILNNADNGEQASGEVQENTKNQNEKNSDEKSEKGNSGAEVEDENSEIDSSEENEEEQEEKPSEEDLILTESDDPNVIQSIINPSWEPTGTTQSGEHVSNYSSGSTDRIEMEKAMAYATGVSVDNMTVWWVGNGGLPNQNVVGTISTKDKSETFRVYLDWVDGEGWKPTKVEQLRENDKGR